MGYWCRWLCLFEDFGILEFANLSLDEPTMETFLLEYDGEEVVGVTSTWDFYDVIFWCVIDE